MGIFKPLYCRRSDAKLEIIAKGSRIRELNQPTPDQLDQRPDKHGGSDYYREVGVDEMKSLDWRRKLGGMLARELDWKEKPGSDNSYMLVAFPENYRLYEHVKKTEADGKTVVKSKTHAGGSNDRQDAYLYGHPGGRKKRFRSPADFFPHLLWLCTDESGDPDNCGCKICSPEDLEAAIPGAKVKTERPTIKQDFAFKSATPSSSTMSPQSSAQGLKIKQEPGVQSPRLPRTPTPLPKAKSSDQDQDRQYHTFMYRPGELIWFQKGHAWGLGIVLRRWKTPASGQTQHCYSVQPLSYPGHVQSAMVKTSDFGCRPWLAWSVPKFTHDGLNHLSEPPKYDTADWQGLAQGRYGHGEMEVDASILAAKAVDGTYTPHGLIRTSEPEPGDKEACYEGLYIGAERIGLGDPVRLAVGSGTDIMIVHSIIERTRASQPTATYLVGDIYSLVTVPHRIQDSNPNIPSPTNPTPNNPYIPQRMLEDLRIRNSRSIPAKNQASYWKLINTQSKLALDDIKGRWYEATIIMPILQPQQYENTLRKGEVMEASLWMNSRGDCQNAPRSPGLPKLPKPNVREETRKEALGKAVPPDIQIIDGADPPGPANIDPALGGSSTQPMEIDPRFETAGGDDEHDTGGSRPGAGGFEELMNLDGMDEQSALPGFGQEYNSQGGTTGGYY